MAEKTLITIKDAKVRITGKGVTPEMTDRDAVHAAVRNAKSNRLKGDADRQAIAMHTLALLRIVAGATADSLDERRDWIAAGRPHIIVDAADLKPECRGLPPKQWNDGAFMASVLQWVAGIAGKTAPEIGRLRVTPGGWETGDHRFYIIPSAPE